MARKAFELPLRLTRLAPRGRVAPKSISVWPKVEVLEARQSPSDLFSLLTQGDQGIARSANHFSARQEYVAYPNPFAPKPNFTWSRDVRGLEKKVFQAILTYHHEGNSIEEDAQSYEVRIGKGGQIYSI